MVRAPRDLSIWAVLNASPNHARDIRLLSLRHGLSERQKGSPNSSKTAMIHLLLLRGNRPEADDVALDKDLAPG